METRTELIRVFKKSYFEVDKSANQIEKYGIIEQRPSPWDSAVTLVARSDGSPRFCVDHRSTINKSLNRKSWPMSDMEVHIDTVAGTKFITVCGVQVHTTKYL